MANKNEITVKCPDCQIGFIYTENELKDDGVHMFIKPCTNCKKVYDVDELFTAITPNKK